MPYNDGSFTLHAIGPRPACIIYWQLISLMLVNMLNMRRIQTVLTDCNALKTCELGTGPAIATRRQFYSSIMNTLPPGKQHQQNGVKKLLASMLYRSYGNYAMHCVTVEYIV